MTGLGDRGDIGARKAEVEALNATRDPEGDTPPLVHGAGWVFESARDGWGVRGPAYCVRSGARGYELGDRARDAQDVENRRNAKREGDDLADLFSYRLVAGSKRREPGEYARKTAAEMGWASPVPLFDAFQPERETRALRTGLVASEVETLGRLVR